MQLYFVAAGRLRDRGLRELLDDYLRRIERYARCTEVEIKERPERSFEERFRKAVPDASEVVMLDAAGTRRSSEGLAKWLGTAEDQGRTLTFIVGGAYGFPDSVRELADSALSLSPLTFPHRLARVMLAEQIYRSFTILRGEPYSH